MPSKTLDKEIVQGLIDIPRSEAKLLLEAGHFLMQLGQIKEARDIFMGTSALFPHSDIPCIELGVLYLSEGKAELAVKEYHRALEREPESATAWAYLGEALLFQKKKEEGLSALKKSISMDPKGPGAKLAGELLRANDLHVFDKT
jgi:tetratricopeptide (TPR) repeat protein